MNKLLPMARNENIVVQELEKELLLYDLEKNKAFCLNQTSAIVWQSCDGRKTISQIAGILGKQFKTSANEDLVWLAIEHLKRDNLLANADELPNIFEKINRREVIKKIGLSTMIALPIISSVIAPKAVAAQSGNVADPFCAACPSNGSFCMIGGSYSIGCFPDSSSCIAAGQASNLCCFGRQSIGWTVINPTAVCCTVFC